MSEPSPQRPPQLHMLWPQGRVPPTPVAPGYRMRLFRPEDTAAYLALMARTDLAHWDEEALEWNTQTLLPDGFFVVEDLESGTVVASSMAHHKPSSLHPEGGEVGWVVADPGHAGRGLGRWVVSQAVRRLQAGGYRHIYLSTDDFRLPALQTYLSLGFEPLLYTEGMLERWEAVRAALERKTP